MADELDFNAERRSATGDAKRTAPARRRGKFFYLFATLRPDVGAYVYS